MSTITRGKEIYVHNTEYAIIIIIDRLCGLVLATDPEVSG
jgi:hypothetical protein